MVRVFIAVLFFGCLAVVAQTSRSHYLIRGRIVDEQGKPRSGAGVCLEPTFKKSSTFEIFIECVRTSADGIFSVNREKSEKGIQQSLFVYVHAKPGTLPLVDAPFDEIRRVDKSFEGVPVKLGSRQLVDLGDLRVQFFFGSATLKLPWASEQPIDWLRTYIQVETKQGHLARFRTLSVESVKKYVSGDGTSVDVSLPIGEWKIKLVEMSTGRKLAESELFRITKTGHELITLSRFY